MLEIFAGNFKRPGNLAQSHARNQQFSPLIGGFHRLAEYRLSYLLGSAIQ